jgi:putative ATP-dependent endonuclease of OLD family
MRLRKIRLSNFQSFGPEPTEVALRYTNFLIGPNGAGKTAVLIALCRMFAADQRYRGIQASDFHRPLAGEPADDEPLKLWIEAEFSIPEAAEEDLETSAIPACFHHMKLEDVEGPPVLRVRLEAILHPEDEVEESIFYVTQVDEAGNPAVKYQVPRTDRHYIQMHYLPARRDPAEHIAFSANALIGRFLRAAEWAEQQEELKDLNESIQNSLGENEAIKSLTKRIGARWKKLHKGDFFKNPAISFGSTEITRILKLLSLTFSPTHHDQAVEFSRLSDGQKSLLYLSIVLASHSITKQIVSGETTGFDPQKLKPPVFTLVAMEEPENSLSPHYLGRVVAELIAFGKKQGAQALVTTHCPSILRRVDPRNIRHLRLGENRQTVASRILLPGTDVKESKYIREAVQAYPEIYFSRLVILGEGDTEEIVLHRVLKACDLAADDTSISIAPLGGRHVNHFWRLLTALNIPCVTLLDFDLGRFGGGWGRIRYAYGQLLKIGCDVEQDYIDELPAWKSDSTEWEEDLEWLEAKGVYFSSPLDADFLMLEQFPDEYGVTAAKRIAPSAATLRSVLGKKRSEHDLFDDDQLELFGQYHKKFKLDSKPASHLAALSKLSDDELSENLPSVFKRLLDDVRQRLKDLPE